MKMWKQVWHVVKKDARQFRWLIGAIVVAGGYAVQTAMSTAVHEGDVPILAKEFSIQGGPALAMLFMAILLTALMVQADSPSRSDAFWASRPLQPVAVLLAKGALLLVVAVALPLVGEVFALAHHQVPAAEIGPVLVSGALMQVAVLVGAAVLAALTADLAAFFAAGIGMTVAYTVFAYAVERTLIPDAFDAVTVVQMALGAGLVGGSVLVHQYQTKNLRRSVWATVIGSAVGIVLIGAASTGPLETREANVAPELLSTNVVWGDFDVEPMPRSNAGAGHAWALRTTIQLEGADPRYEYALSTSRAKLTFADGSEIVSRLRSGPLLTHATGAVVAQTVNEVSLTRSSGALSGSDWSIAPLMDTGPERLTVAQLNQAQLDMLRAEGARIELIDGRVDVLAARERTTLPLEVGTVVKIPGQRFQVMSVGSAGGAGPVATVQWEEVHPFEDGPITRFDSDYVGFAFVDPATRQGVMAPTTIRFRYGHTGVLFAGWTTATRSVEVETPSTFVDGELVPSRSAEWFADSELLVIEVESIGDYWLEVETEITDVEIPGGERSR